MKIYIDINKYITISLDNDKLGGFIPSINLPAIITCNRLAPCANGGGCYACKGNFNFKNVKESALNNLKIFNEDSNAYFNAIIDFLKNGLVNYKYFRYHASGDIVNANYLNGMIATANVCKNTTFLCFTKKFDIVNNYLSTGAKLPKNLKIVFSAWDTEFFVPNLYNLPVSYIEWKDTKQNVIIPKKAYKCNNVCANCLICWQLKKGESVKFKKH